MIDPNPSRTAPLVGDAAFTLAGEPLVLLPERAIHRPAAAELLVADAHWGKAATFRAHGVPVPGGTTSDGLTRLTSALERTGARRLVFLGDLFHAREGKAPRTLAAVAAWRERHASVEMVLVRGNHDRHAGDPPEALEIACVEEPWARPPFILRHHPAPSDEGYVLAGHLHPAVRLIGRARQKERLPCFHFGPRVGVLPAFGAFTGSLSVEPAAGDRVFVVAGEAVLDVSA